MLFAVIWHFGHSMAGFGMGLWQLGQARAIFALQRGQINSAGPKGLGGAGGFGIHKARSPVIRKMSKSRTPISKPIDRPSCAAIANHPTP
jgi:hypothetical protein